MAPNPEMMITAIQLLFFAYIVSPSHIAADRITLVLAFDLLCVAELLSCGLALVLRSIIAISAPRNPRPLMIATVDIVIPLIVNLYSISRFLEQLHPGAPAIDFNIIRKRHVVLVLLSLWLLLSRFLLGTWHHLLSTRPTDREDSRRRLRNFWLMVAAVSDVCMCLLLALTSHLVFWKILDTAGPPGNTSEATTLTRMDEISKIRAMSGWLLVARDFYVVALEDVFLRRIRDAQNI